MTSREFLAYETSRSYHFQYNCCDIGENDPREGLSVVIFIIEFSSINDPSFRYRWQVDYPAVKKRWYKGETRYGIAASYAQAVEDIHMFLSKKGIAPMPNEHNKRLSHSHFAWQKRTPEENFMTTKIAIMADTHSFTTNYTMISGVYEAYVYEGHPIEINRVNGPGRGTIVNAGPNKVEVVEKNDEEDVSIVLKPYESMMLEAYGGGFFEIKE